MRCCAIEGKGLIRQTMFLMYVICLHILFNLLVTNDGKSGSGNNTTFTLFAIIPDAVLGKRASCFQHLRWLNKSMVMRIFFRQKNDVSPSLNLPDYNCIWRPYHFSQLSHSASSSLQHFAMSSHHSFVFSICIVIGCPTFQMKMSQGCSECSVATRPTLWGR